MKHWKMILGASAGSALVFAGCQTAPWRSPAMGGGRHNSPDSSELVRITTVNGTYDQDHGGSINVNPGDVIQLSADVFNTSGDGYAAENRDVSEFTWSASDSDSDVCVASIAHDCLDVSLFEVNDYGVSFYVPQNFSAPITITVTDANAPAAGADSLTLTLNPAVVGYVPPTVVITEPSQYSCPEFNEDCALAHQGHWVYIDGMRYFVPFTSSPDWQPYVHGYWTWVDGEGWTWVSYDPWGWYTDHYGYWRHHGVYGWIWSPFDDHVYRPAVVSWYYGDAHVGWYPYYDEWNRTHPYWGPEHGFDDGYWGGFHPAEFYAPFHPGFYYVAYGDFGAADVSLHRPADFDGPAFYRGCYEEQRFGAWPGGRDIDASHEYMNRRVPNVMITHVEQHQFGNDNMRFPSPVRQVPDQYRAIPGQLQRFDHRPIPVGSVFNHGEPVPPTENHRGIVAPPIMRDGGGEVHPMPPRTMNPARPSGNNPIYHPPTVPERPWQPPVYHPGQNGGSVPWHGSNGNHAWHPRPQPMPRPQPRPVNPPENGGNFGNNGNPGWRPEPRPMPPRRPEWPNREIRPPRDQASLNDGGTNDQ